MLLFHKKILAHSSKLRDTVHWMLSIQYVWSYNSCLDKLSIISCKNNIFLRVAIFGFILKIMARGGIYNSNVLYQWHQNTQFQITKQVSDSNFKHLFNNVICFRYEIIKLKAVAIRLSLQLSHVSNYFINNYKRHWIRDFK